MKKRIIAMFMSAMMITSLIPQTALADQVTPEEEVITLAEDAENLEIEEDEVTLEAYVGQVYFAGCRREDNWHWVYSDETSSTIAYYVDLIDGYNSVCGGGTVYARGTDEELIDLWPITDYVTIDSDESTFSINGRAIAEKIRESGYQLDEVTVTYRLEALDEDGQPLAAEILAFEIKDPSAEYYVSNIGDNYHVGSSCYFDHINYRVESRIFPYGSEGNLAINGIESQGGCVDIVEEGGGYRVWFEHAGGEELVFSFNDIDSNEQTLTYNFQVSNERFNLNFGFPNDTSCMLPNSTMEINTQFSHEWYYSDEDQGWREMKDYSLSATSDNDQISVSVDGTVISVSSGEDCADAVINVTAIEEGTGNATSADIEIHVTGSYTYIELPEYDSRLALGDEMTIAPKYMRAYSEDGENYETEYDGNICYLVEYDHNAVEITDQDGVTMTNESFADELIIRRTGPYATHIEIIAYEEIEHDYFECGRKGIDLEDFMATLYFDNMREGERFTWVFLDEELTIGANSSVFDEYDLDELTLNWRFYEETEYGRGDELEVTFSTEDTSITIAGSDIFAAVGATNEPVQAVFTVQYGDTVLAENSFAIECRKERTDYRQNFEDKTILTEESFSIDKYFSAYMENAYVPYGGDVEVHIANVKVKSVVEDVKAEEILIVNETDQGFEFKAVGIGGVTVTLEIEYDGGNFDTIEMDVMVVPERMSLIVNYPEYTQEMLPDSQMAIDLGVQYEWKRDGERGCDYVSDFTIEDLDYDTDYVTVSISDDGSQLIVNSKSQTTTKDTWIRLCVSYTTKDNSKLNIEAFVPVAIRDSYYYIAEFAIKKDMPISSETLVTPTVFFVTSLNGERVDTVVPGSQLRITASFEKCFLKVTDMQGNEIESDQVLEDGSSLVVKRLSAYRSDFGISVEVTDEADGHCIAGLARYIELSELVDPVGPEDDDSDAAPSETTITKLTNTDAGVKITWGKVEKASGYILYKCDANGDYNELTTIDSGATVSYVDTTAGNGKTCYYKVKAYNVYNGKTYYSTLSEAESCVYVASTQISSLTNTAKGVKVTWKKNSAATGYILYKRDAKGTYKELTTIKSGATVSYVDPAAVNGKSCSYKVKAYYTSSSATYYSVLSSAKGSVFVAAGEITKLTNSAKGLQITWKKNSAATGYILYKRDAGGTYKKYKVIKSNTTVSYVDPAAVNGKSSYYKVKPYYTNSSGTTYYGAVSAAKGSIFVKKGVLKAVTSTAPRKATVTWTKNAAATSYQISYTIKGATKTVTVRAGTTSKTLTGLTSGKYLSVKVRSVVKGTSASYYGAWSDTVKVKVK